MAERIGVSDAKSEGENIEVGQHRCHNPGDEKSTRNGFGTEAQAKGKRDGRMGDDRGHVQADQEQFAVSTLGPSISVAAKLIGNSLSSVSTPFVNGCAEKNSKYRAGLGESVKNGFA